MALRFIDSFDRYATADLLAHTKYTGHSTNWWDPAIGGSSGRRGGGAFYIPYGQYNSNVYIYKILDNQQTWIVGFAFNTSAYAGFVTPLALYDVGGTTWQMSLCIESSGALTVYRGLRSTLLGTTTNLISTNQWNYIEFKVKIANSGGTADIHVNGASWLSLSSIDTCSNSNEYASGIYLGQVGAGGTNAVGEFIDDLYVCDGTGATNNDFLGDCRVDAYLPNGNGTYSQFVGSDSDSVDNYLHVDDTTPDADSTYTQANTVGNMDTYAITDMTHTPAPIYGVQAVSVAKKDDVGSRQIALECRSNSTDYNGSSQTLSTSYTSYLQVWEVNPNTSAAWTKSNLNSAEFGLKIVL